MTLQITRTMFPNHNARKKIIGRLTQIMWRTIVRCCVTIVTTCTRCNIRHFTLWISDWLNNLTGHSIRITLNAWSECCLQSYASPPDDIVRFSKSFYCTCCYINFMLFVYLWCYLNFIAHIVVYLVIIYLFELCSFFSWKMNVNNN